MIEALRIDDCRPGATTALSVRQTAIGRARPGYAPHMELLAIVALVGVVAVVLLFRRRGKQPPDQPESTGNDPK
ncbi:hypothetical protein ACIGO9_22715 [Nocardia asteroides]|uniref:hypothetical protein n=1 Tax=Nocardia asteroides TaxID=1824 RepID=UPI0037C7C181